MPGRVAHHCAIMRHAPSANRRESEFILMDRHVENSLVASLVLFVIRIEEKEGTHGDELRGHYR
jgi:hypothetical protein